MALAPGDRLGAYEVVGSLGEGGMGEVYRARDAKLNRDVALKILPEGFGADPDRLTRLRREAQVLAALSHPNIGQIYGFEDSGVTHALVLELIEGPTLADRIAKGPIPLDEALPIAKQIAEALEAAHEIGIVHRDLKPANIKVTDAGVVKVLDFGLAKAFDPAVSASGGYRPGPAATVTSPAMTAMGVILGTAAYMSPEQAKGRAVDKRTDIWAFGVVLHEVLSGRRLFDAEDISETLAAVLTRETTAASLPAALPARLKALVASCLVRDPKHRLRDIGDARIELDRLLAGIRDPASAAAPAAAVRWAWPAVAATFFAAAAALAGALYLRPAPSSQPFRFNLTLASDSFRASRLSPDGRRLAAVQTEPDPVVVIHSFETGTLETLVSTAGVGPPAVEWSPDGQQLAFVAAGKLRTIAAAGGPSQVIANLPGPRLVTSWGTRGEILIEPMTGQGGPVLRVPATGGEPRPATELDASKGEVGHHFANFLPDGRQFTFLAADRNGRTAYVGALDSRERWPLPGIMSAARYSESGHLLFLRDGALMAQPFDPGRRALSGSPTVVVDALASPAAAVGAFHVSVNGTLVYRALPPQKSALVWFDRNGRQIATASPVAEYGDIELSLDDRYVTFESGLPGDIAVIDLRNGVTERLTSDPSRDADPVWSPDGKTVAFRADRDGGHLYARTFGDVGQDRPLLKGNTRDSPSSWSRDGRYLVFDSQNSISALPMSGDPTPIRLVSDPAVQPQDGQVSPDGRWIAYQAREMGRSEVFVQSFPQPGTQRRVSPAGGSVPRWSRDGRELFYLAPGNVLMSVAVSSGGEPLNLGPPARLFEMRIVRVGGEGEYAVASDGRFLVNVPSGETTAPLTVVLSWAAGLKNGTR